MVGQSTYAAKTTEFKRSQSQHLGQQAWIPRIVPVQLAPAARLANQALSWRNGKRVSSLSALLSPRKWKSPRKRKTIGLTLAATGIASGILAAAVVAVVAALAAVRAAAVRAAKNGAAAGMTIGAPPPGEREKRGVLSFKYFSDFYKLAKIPFKTRKSKKKNGQLKDLSSEQKDITIKLHKKKSYLFNYT